MGDGFEDALDGSIVLKPQYPFLEDFVQFSAHNKPSVQDFLPIKDIFCRTTLGEDSNCTLQAESLQSVVNSAFLFANSLRRVLEDELACKESTSCRRKTKTANFVQRMGDGLRKISDSAAAEGVEGHKVTRFLFYNLQKRGLILKSERIGSWEDRPHINNHFLRWKNGVKHVPQSTCGLPCPVGHVRVSVTGRECCWECKPCNYNQFVFNNYTCADCKRGYWPTSDFKTCDFSWGFAIFNSVMYMFFAVSVFIFVAI